MGKKDSSDTRKRERECYLVTGAGGHLGHALVSELLRQRKGVRVLLLPGDFSVFPPEVERYYGNVCEKESMDSFFEKAEGEKTIVLHCAGIVSIRSSYEQVVMDVNAGGTKNVLGQCVENAVDKLVYVSSVHAIEDRTGESPITETNIFSPKRVVGVYAKSKAIATKMVLDTAAKTGLDASVVHPSGIIGPYDQGNNHIVAMIEQFCRGKLPVGIKGGYDFVDVRDVASGVIACASQGRAGECYILSGHYASIQELFVLLEEISGQKAPSLYLTPTMAGIFAPAAEWYAKWRHTRPVYTKYSVYTLGTNAVFSYQKAQKELGYHPRELRETLKDTVAWIRRRTTEK